MFRALARTEAGERDLPTTILVSHGGADGETRIPHDDLDAVRKRGTEEWLPAGLAPGVLDSLLEDAATADLLAGGRPEDWAPIGLPRPQSLGRLDANEELWSKKSGSRHRLMGTGVASDGSVGVALTDEDGSPVAALAIGGSSFATLVPRGADELIVTAIPERPWEIAGRAEAVELARRGGPRRVRRHLLWRLYQGENTARVDGSTLGRGGVHRIRLGGARTVGLLVGRIVYAVPMRHRPRSDPFAAKRLAAFESADAATAGTCPRIEDAEPAPGSECPVVVAVHGTMSTAMPLASVLRQVASPGTRIVRFEHDTWLPVPENARTLADAVRRLGAPRVVLVAHSRGGLVARTAAQLLAGGAAMELFTLGTPFAGTPVVDGVGRGLLGVKVLLGALRTATSTLVVDVPTRLLGFLVKDLPPGLRAMAPGDEVLQLIAAFGAASGASIAGSVDPAFTADSWGLGFLHGFAVSAFAGADNDLVVSASSAGAGGMPTRVVASDHFSYLLRQEVLTALTALTDCPEAARREAAAEQERLRVRELQERLKARAPRLSLRRER